MSNDTGLLKRTLGEISNRIYATDGVLKDRVFIDICRLLAIKIQSENDPTCKLLDPSYLPSISASELTNWAADLLKYGTRSGVELIDNDFWNIKTQSLHWAAMRLAIFKLGEFTADIKGEAFQLFVVNNLRGDRGEYFTPEPLVDALCSAAELKEGSLVLDPACGSGGFLYGAFLKGVSPANLFGIEMGRDIAVSAQLRIKILGGSEKQITCASAFEVFDGHENKYDAVLMNPPFGSRAKIDDPDLLGKFEISRFLSSRGNSLKSLAPEVLFLEMGIRCLKADGVLGAVIPDGILQNSSYFQLREWIKTKADLEAIISCPANTFIPYGTGVKTSLLIVRKKRDGGGVSKVYFAVSNKVGYDARGKKIYKSELSPSASGEALFNSRVDEDLSPIISEFNVLRKSHIDQLDLIGTLVQSTSVANRWDAEFYQESDREFIDGLTGFPHLSAIAKLKHSKIKLSDLKGQQQYIAISDVDSRTSQIINVQEIEARSLPSRAAYVAGEGDVITAVSGGSTGTQKHASAMIPPEFDGAIVSSGFALLRPLGVTRFQLLGFLRSEMFLKQVKRLRTGHAIPSISIESLLNIYIPKLDDPIWVQWDVSMKELEFRAQNLFSFSDQSRQL